jgi:glutamate carboxypeptidase
MIEGGKVLNTVPAHCSFCVNIRFATAEQLAWVENYVREVADRVHVPGTRTTVTKIGFRIAMEYAERNYALLDTMNRIFEENGLTTLAPHKGKGGSDAADVTACGIPCVDSIGTLGGYVHSPQEYGYISSLALSAKRIASVVYCI